MSFCKFLSLLAYPSKRLKTYAAIRSTAGIHNQFGQGNVHGCGCVYSDWCLDSEVDFDYFAISAITVISYTFRLWCVQFIFFGDPNILSTVCKLLSPLYGPLLKLGYVMEIEYNIS